MIAKVTGVRLKELPSKFGGTWKLATVKLEGYGDEKFELQGFGSKFVERVKEGEMLKGYISSKVYNNIETKTFNAITAEYVYELLMEMKGTPTAPSSPASDPGPTDEEIDNW